MMDKEFKASLAIRLKKLEGQIRGINGILDDDRYCIDILNQTRAVISGMKKVEERILENHMKTCVTSSFESTDKEDQQRKINEVINLLSKYR